jgi:hypothetical protein
MVFVGVGVEVFVGVAPGVEVLVGVEVFVGVTPGVEVLVGVAVGVGVLVGVTAGVEVLVGVGVGVTQSCEQAEYIGIIPEFAKFGFIQTTVFTLIPDT